MKNLLKVSSNVSVNDEAFSVITSSLSNFIDISIKEPKVIQKFGNVFGVLDDMIKRDFITSIELLVLGEEVFSVKKNKDAIFNFIEKFNHSRNFNYLYVRVGVNFYLVKTKYSF